MKERGIGQGVEGGVRQKTGGLVVMPASVATAGTHGSIQYFALN